MRAQVHHRCHGLVNLVHPGPGGVDAEGRQKLPAIHLQVGRGPAQLPAQASAAHHPALEAVGAFQQGLRRGEVASLQGRPDAAAAHPTLLVFDDLRDQHLHAAGTGNPCQQLGITAAITPKPEVGSHCDPLRLQNIQQNRFNESFSAQLSQLLGEWHQHQLLDAKGFQQIHLFAGKVETQPGFPKQHLPRMGPEADHRRHGS